MLVKFRQEQQMKHEKSKRATLKLNEAKVAGAQLRYDTLLLYTLLSYTPLTTPLRTPV
jgi:hypothetical protein